MPRAYAGQTNFAVGAHEVGEMGDTRCGISAQAGPVQGTALGCLAATQRPNEQLLGMMPGSCHMRAFALRLILILRLY